MDVKNQIVCVSGGFDPLHVGHIHYLLGASCFGKVVVILNSDKWLRRKKGYVLMPWHERKEILLATKWVSSVVPVNDDDDTVCEAVKQIRPNVFANGGSRGRSNTPERELCESLGIKMVWGIGGGERDHYTLKLDELIKKISIEQ